MNESPREATIPEDSQKQEGRPFNELRDSGLLWLINRAVFHPRGYAIGLNYRIDPERDPISAGGDCTGWTLLGDGSEPWSMGDATPDEIARGALTEDQLFALVQDLLK